MLLFVHVQTLQFPHRTLYIPDPGDDEGKDKNVWLFNIAEDPNEHKDLSDEKPEVVKELLDLLVKFNQTAVPARYPAEDPKCDPLRHGGVWGPWM